MRLIARLLIVPANTKERIMQNRSQCHTGERGAVVVTLALLVFLLLGFIGLALDYGHLFVIRTELQTSMDACALAAAHELNGQPDALTRARNAGIAAGNANNVDLQSANWSSKPKIVEDEITFLEEDHKTLATSASARFVRCVHTQAGTSTPLLQMLGLLGNASSSSSSVNVGALAEATTTPAQSVCTIPLMLKQKAGSTAPDYGFVKGEWVKLLSKAAATNGNIGWANLDGSNNASETAAEMKGHCGTSIGTHMGTPGVQQSIADVWNSRFGIYKKKGDAAVDHPDFTGYVYTGSTWTPGRNAYPDFVTRRQNFENCAVTVNDCEKKTGLKLNAAALATSGAGGELQTYGTNRRLVALPVADDANKVKDFVCMLLLQPIPTPMEDVWLEYLGNAAELGSPCKASGLPGGTAGPLVPVLIR